MTTCLSVPFHTQWDGMVRGCDVDGMCGDGDGMCGGNHPCDLFPLHPFPQGLPMAV